MKKTRKERKKEGGGRGKRMVEARGGGAKGYIRKHYDLGIIPI